MTLSLQDYTDHIVTLGLGCAKTLAVDDGAKMQACAVFFGVLALMGLWQTLLLFVYPVFFLVGAIVGSGFLSLKSWDLLFTSKAKLCPRGISDDLVEATLEPEQEFKVLLIYHLRLIEQGFKVLLIY